MLYLINVKGKRLEDGTEFSPVVIQVDNRPFYIKLLYYVIFLYNEPSQMNLIRQCIMHFLIKCSTTLHNNNKTKQKLNIT